MFICLNGILSNGRCLGGTVYYQEVAGFLACVNCILDGSRC